ncbi:MAG TPA: HAMP domain-containing protein, partial [Thermoanaerobaculia bacterium]|nr:HAMP domain-containing protein [Thermoanaerobaculia bacterium]
MSEARRGLTLGGRVFLGMALMLLAALGAAVAVTSVLGERIAAREARERIAASASVQNVSQQQRFQQLGLLAEIMASKPDFKAYLFEAIRTHDRLSILDQLDERKSELGYDLAIVVDADGVLAARTDLPDIAGVDLSTRPLFRKVREEFEAAGVWSERGRLFEAVAVPMAVDEGIFGFLALGYAITDVRALEVKRGTGSEAVFLADPTAAPVASSMTPQETERVLGALRGAGALAAVAGGKTESVQQELELAGERWLAQLRPLHDAGETPVGVALSLVSLDRELEGYASVRNVLLAVGGAALLAALGVSFLLARRVTRPIQDLVRATAAAREGRYDVTTPPGGSGEVVALANSFNALLAELRERREMAEYVEKLARNLPEATARGASAPEQPAAVREATLVGIELRRHGRLRPGQQASGLLERLTGDLQKIAAALAAQGGTVEAVHGQRVLATFTGANRSERALAATAELGAAIGRPEHAFDESAPPAAAIAAGELVSGSVRWGETSDRALLGLPLQQVEGLLREAGEGEILVAAAVHTELAGAFSSAGVDLRPHRGLLSTQPFYLVTYEQAERVAASAGRLLTHVTAAEEPAGGERASLAGIGPGSLLGSRFEILAVLGAGGMGVVYKARDRELDDLVALKMLRRDVAGDQALVARLKTELKLARKITHPNVLRTYDFGEIDGHPFISMEYVRGITMRSMIEQSGRLPYSAALWLARQLL